MRCEHKHQNIVLIPVSISKPQHYSKVMCTNCRMKLFNIYLLTFLLFYLLVRLIQTASSHFPLKKKKSSCFLCVLAFSWCLLLFLIPRFQWEQKQQHLRNMLLLSLLLWSTREHMGAFFIFMIVILHSHTLASKWHATFPATVCQSLPISCQIQADPAGLVPGRSFSITRPNTDVN